MYKYQKELLDNYKDGGAKALIVKEFKSLPSYETTKELNLQVSGQLGVATALIEELVTIIEQQEIELKTFKN